MRSFGAAIGYGWGVCCGVVFEDGQGVAVVVGVLQGGEEDGEVVAVFGATVPGSEVVGECVHAVWRG